MVEVSQLKNLENSLNKRRRLTTSSLDLKTATLALDITQKLATYSMLLTGT